MTMSIDQLTDSNTWKFFATIITGGAFVGWYREHRRAKKDVATFSLRFMEIQSAELASERARVDKLVQDMADLQVNHALDRAGYREALAAKDVEISRLRAELAHYAPREVVAEPITTVTTNPPVEESPA